MAKQNEAAKRGTARYTAIMYVDSTKTFAIRDDSLLKALRDANNSQIGLSGAKGDKNEKVPTAHAITILTYSEVQHALELGIKINGLQLVNGVVKPTPEFYLNFDPYQRIIRTAMQYYGQEIDPSIGTINLLQDKLMSEDGVTESEANERLALLAAYYLHSSRVVMGESYSLKTKEQETVKDVAKKGRQDDYVKEKQKSLNSLISVDDKNISLKNADWVYFGFVCAKYLQVVNYDDTALLEHLDKYKESIGSVVSKRGKDESSKSLYCTLGHPVYNLHIAVDLHNPKNMLGVMDFEYGTDANGKSIVTSVKVDPVKLLEQTMPLSGTADERTAFGFGSSCISDFFRQDTTAGSDFTKHIKHIQQRAEEEMSGLVDYYDDIKHIHGMQDSFVYFKEIMDKLAAKYNMLTFFNDAQKAEITGMLDKYSDCERVALYQGFCHHNLLFPKSFVRELRNVFTAIPITPYTVKGKNGADVQDGVLDIKVLSERLREFYGVTTYDALCSALERDAAKKADLLKVTPVQADDAGDDNDKGKKAKVVVSPSWEKVRVKQGDVTKKVANFRFYQMVLEKFFMLDFMGAYAFSPKPNIDASKAELAGLDFKTFQTQNGDDGGFNQNNMEHFDAIKACENVDILCDMNIDFTGLTFENVLEKLNTFVVAQEKCEKISGIIKNMFVLKQRGAFDAANNPTPIVVDVVADSTDKCKPTVAAFKAFVTKGSLAGNIFGSYTTSMYGSINKEKFSDRTYEWGMAGKKGTPSVQNKVLYDFFVNGIPTIPTKGRSKVVTLDSIVEFYTKMADEGTAFVDTAMTWAKTQATAVADLYNKFLNAKNEKETQTGVALTDKEAEALMQQIIQGKVKVNVATSNADASVGTLFADIAQLNKADETDADTNLDALLGGLDDGSEDFGADMPAPVETEPEVEKETPIDAEVEAEIEAEAEAQVEDETSIDAETEAEIEAEIEAEAEAQVEDETPVETAADTDFDTDEFDFTPIEGSEDDTEDIALESEDDFDFTLDTTADDADDDEFDFTIDDTADDFDFTPTEDVAEEAPVEETPVEEAPIEETPVEEAPVEETPVEEVKPKASKSKDAEFIDVDLPSEIMDKFADAVYSSDYEDICNDEKLISNDEICNMLLALIENPAYRTFVEVSGNNGQALMQLDSLKTDKNTKLNIFAMKRLRSIAGKLVYKYAEDKKAASDDFWF